AKWCLDDQAGAIEYWYDGVDCRFADAGLGIILPLLLLFASTVKPDLFSKTKAEGLLLRRANDPRARTWPGPLAKFVLEQMDESQLRNECAYPMDDEAALRHMRADFYIGVVEYRRGNQYGFLQKMQQASRLTWEDFDASRDRFLARIWREEFFLARHECQ